MIDWEARSATSGGNTDLRIGGGAAMHIAGLALKGWRPTIFALRPTAARRKLTKTQAAPQGFPRS